MRGSAKGGRSEAGGNSVRNRYIVAYDVSDEKRLRKVFKTMRGYGDPIQYSVFRCDLSDKEKVLMFEALGKVINHKEDQVLVIDIGPPDARGSECVEILGRPSPAPVQETVVV